CCTALQDLRRLKPGVARSGRLQDPTLPMSSSRFFLPAGRCRRNSGPSPLPGGPAAPQYRGDSRRPPTASSIVEGALHMTTTSTTQTLPQLGTLAARAVDARKIYGVGGATVTALDDVTVGFDAGAFT